MSPRGKLALTLSSIFSALALTAVLMRLYTRFWVIRFPGIEDYCITLSMICSIGLTVSIGIQAKHGMGQHIKELDSVDSLHSLKAFYASLIVYYLSLGLTKISILFQYRRVFITRHFHFACWVVMGIVTAYASWTVFSSIFACKPVQAFWTLSEPFTCLNQLAVWFFNGGMNILTDFAIIVLPMPVIRKLNLSPRQKHALIGIFAVGGLVCIVSIIRLQSLVAISNSLDPTYDNPPAATWSSIEANVGIICSCLPCLRPLITQYLPTIFSNSSQAPGSSSSTANNRSKGGSQHPRCLSQRIFGGRAEAHARAVKREMERRGEGNPIIRVVTEVHVMVEEDGEGGAEA